MAFPGRGNGLMEEDNNENKNALFEEEGLEELDAHAPPHLRAIAYASQQGDLDALRLALDNLVGSIDDAVDDGDTALHLACLYGASSYFWREEQIWRLRMKMEQFLCMMLVPGPVGYTEVVQLLINSANDAERVKRMLETVDAEGDVTILRQPLHHAALPTKANL